MTMTVVGIVTIFLLINGLAMGTSQSHRSGAMRSYAFEIAATMPEECASVRLAPDAVELSWKPVSGHRQMDLRERDSLPKNPVWASLLAQCPQKEATQLVLTHLDRDWIRLEVATPAAAPRSYTFYRG